MGFFNRNFYEGIFRFFWGGRIGVRLGHQIGYPWKFSDGPSVGDLDGFCLKYWMVRHSDNQKIFRLGGQKGGVSR